MITSSRWFSGAAFVYVLLSLTAHFSLADTSSAAVADSIFDDRNHSGPQGNVTPPCPAYGRDLPLNNQQVAHWRRTTDNQFRERGHVKGPIVSVFPDKNGHDHFSISIGNRPEDQLEVIYNQDFGQIPSPRLGMIVEACGDYITSTRRSGPYPASPAGAIIHWVHKNPAQRGHDPGFLVIDGVLYGQDVTNAFRR